MTESPGTPNGREAGINYEFTPIGYVNEGKENSPGAGLDRESRKRLSHNESIQSPGLDEYEPRKRTRKRDDTLNSTRIFNDSSFDDTLPSQAGIPSLRKNRANEMQNGEGHGENAGASNPLKEQQDSLYKLNLENYNLRVKCNSLLKFLNNVTDEGELKKNLAIIDELQDWKSKYQKLATSYRALQLKIDQIDGKDPEASKEKTKLNKAQLKELEIKLNEYRNSVNNSKQIISKLEDRLRVTSDGSDAKNEQFESKTRTLRQEIGTLESTIAERENTIKEHEIKIKELGVRLEEQKRAREELELKTEEQVRNIEKIETKLSQSEKKIQELQKELERTKDELDYVSRGIDTNDEGAKLQINQLNAANSELKEENAQIVADNRQYQGQVETLKTKSNDLVKEIKARDNKVRALDKELRDLQQQHVKTGKALEEGKSQSSELKALTIEIQQLMKEKASLERDNDSLRERIVTQATRSPALKGNVRKTLEKDSEIEKLRSRIQELENKLDLAKKAANTLHQNHRLEMEQLKAQLESSNVEPLLVQRKLDKQVSILNLELESLRETKDREISLLENKIRLLKQENEELSQHSDSQAGSLQRKALEKQKEIDELVQRCSDLSMEKLRLSKELGQVQESEVDKKRELSKLASRLEYVTKEFVKYRELGSDSDSHNSKLSIKWEEKYRTMRQKLLDELKMLQDENLALEKRMLESKQHIPRSATPDLGRLSLQDQVDYYKLRYNHEVVHNNDLKVMNGYLNRVLRASSRHVRLDIIKLENEALADIWPDFPYRGRLRFKTVALMVLAAVRFQRAALKLRWDAQRINYLRQKIVLDQDRVTW